MSTPITNNSFFYRSIPFITPPALKPHNSFQVDFDTLQARVSRTAIAIFIICFGTGFILNVPVFIVAFGVSLLGVLFFERNRATKAADYNAVQEMLHQTTPSPFASERIRRNESCLKQYLERGGDVNKVDGDQKPLLVDYCPDDVITLLVEAGANYKKPDPFTESFMLQAVRNPKQEKLLALLKSGRILESHFSADEKVEIWTSIGSQEIAETLKEYGFNPNVRNSKDKTPLGILQKQLNDRIEKFSALKAENSPLDLLNNLPCLGIDEGRKIAILKLVGAHD